MNWIEKLIGVILCFWVFVLNMMLLNIDDQMHNANKVIEARKTSWKRLEDAAFVDQIKKMTNEWRQSCYSWAFGPDYPTKHISSLDETWNSRHGDLFRISGSDDIFDTFRKIEDKCIELGKNQ